MGCPEVGVPRGYTFTFENVYLANSTSKKKGPDRRSRRREKTKNVKVGCQTQAHVVDCFHYASNGGSLLTRHEVGEQADGATVATCDVEVPLLVSLCRMCSTLRE